MIKNDVQAIVKNTYSILEENGFHNCTVKINGRLSRALGQAWKKEIDIAKKFAEYGRLDMIEWVILHEVAHLIDKRQRGSTKHDSEFARICRRLGTPLTGATTKKFEIWRDGYVQESVMKYRAVCSTCGNVTYRRGMPKNLRSCGKCSPRVFSYEYTLEYKRVR
jgi:predicted SprT family Zn-dependent metalloprotease